MTVHLIEGPPVRDLAQAVVATVLGSWRVEFGDRGISRVEMLSTRVKALAPGVGKLPINWRKAIERAAAGQEVSTVVPVVLQGSVFQVSVWRALARIPRGAVVCYSEVAERIGHPGAARAVGSACRANPVPLIIPCHRVIGKDARAGGFVAGEKIKRELLEAEGFFGFA